MGKRYLLFFFAGLGITLLIFNHWQIVNIKELSKEVTAASEEKAEEKESGAVKKPAVEDGIREEKEAIGRELLETYINEKSTTTKDSREVKTLTDYKIRSVKFIKGDDKAFTVDTCYDVKYTEEGQFWVAGNGMLEDGNWVIEKRNFLDIEDKGDGFKISDVYTG